MKYVLNGPLREYIYKRHTDETKTKLTQAFLITPASIHTKDKASKYGVIEHIFLLKQLS